jgi:hypothetical protein
MPSELARKHQPDGKVVSLPLPAVDPNTSQALIVLAQRRAAWNRANPNATADEQLAAGAEIAARMGV